MMRYLFCLLIVITSVFAQPVEGPWTLLSWDESPGMSTLKTVGKDTIDVFWDTNISSEETFVYHAVCVLGEDSFLVNPHRIPNASTLGRLSDAILLDNGDWVCAIETDGTEPQILLVKGIYDAEISSEIIYTGQMTDGPCWGDCWEFKLPKLSIMPDGKILVAGSIWHYFDIGSGAREVDSEPYVIVVNPSDLSVEWVATSGLTLFGPTEPAAIADEPVKMLISSNLGSNSSIIALSEQTNPDSLPQVELDCVINEYPRHLFVMLPSLRFLATSDRQLYELSITGTCEEINYFPVPYNILDVQYFPSAGFVMVANDSWSFDGIVLARLDTNGVEISSSGSAFWPDSDRRVNRASVTITESDLLGVFWIENESWPGTLSQLRYVTLGWDTPLSADDPRLMPIPSSMSLSAYPNPFNSTVSLKYELNQASDVGLDIYNLAGQEVAKLVDERQNAGQHSFDWTPQGASGIYFAKLSAGHKDCFSKLVYIR